MSRCLFALIILSGCGAEVPYNDSPTANSDISLCEYKINGICILVQPRMEIDQNALLWAILNTEKNYNKFYPGLDLLSLSIDHNLILEYRWTNRHVEHQATYSTFSGHQMRVYLREGDNITERMGCVDRYFLPTHELLHFINREYLGGDSYVDYIHMTEHVYLEWELAESKKESRIYNYTNIVEGLIYHDISTFCEFD